MAYLKKFFLAKPDRPILLGGLVLLFLCGIYKLSLHYGVVVLDDEFGYWGIGAQITGLDWHELIATCSFYSYGYSILLIPLYLLRLSAMAMYQLAIVVNIGFVMASFCLARWVAGQVFAEIDKRILTIIGLVVTLYSNNVFQMHIAWGETLLYFLFWCVTALICRIRQRDKLIDHILLAVAVIYLYAVHNRTLGVLVTVAGLLLFFYCLSLFHKRPRHKLLLTLVIMAVLFVVASLFRQYTIDNWFSGSPVLSNNDYSGNVERAKGLLQLSGLRNFILGFIGKIFAQGTSSFLLILLPLITAVCHSVKSLFLRIFRRQKVTWELRDWILFYGSVAYLISLAISALFQSSGTVTAHQFFYSRYSDFAIGPIMLLGICMLTEQAKKWRRLIAGMLIYIFSAIVSLIQLGKAESLELNSIHAAGIYHFFTNPGSPFQVVAGMAAVGLVGFLLIAGSSLLLKKKAPHEVWGVFSVCICLAGVYWCILAIQTTSEWLNVNWNKGQKVVVRIDRQMERLDDETVIYYVIAGSVYERRNALSYLKILQTMEPERIIRLVPLEELAERYEGKYVYMSGADETLLGEMMRQGKIVLYNSSEQCIYGDEGSEAVAILGKD